ncbi:MAG: hypothetical protein JXA09_11330 [Anaerolineae bacterium]|nr:hypothetical protein [Anaerolineae bacterium]
MAERSKLMSRLVAITGSVAWGLANGLDIISMLLAIQMGNRFPRMPFHPAESFLIYAGLRALGTIAVWLAALAVGRRWPTLRGSSWTGLTAFALVTAIAAWWRVYG